MKKYIPYIIAILLLATACTEYQKILKSNDPEFKYDKAIEYYTQKKYDKTISLLDDISAYYRQSERSELIINYLAKSFLEKKDYYTAKSYYETYVKTFPKGRFVEEASFMIGYCDYKDVPDVRLDQSVTYTAIQSFQNFIEKYPTSERAKEAATLLDELYDKLTEKELNNATLYYNLGTYLGNNYLSAVITAQNALKTNPATKFREQLSILILRAKYQQAIYSNKELEKQRYQDVIDEYYSYANEFPTGKYIKEAEKIFNHSQKINP